MSLLFWICAALYLALQAVALLTLGGRWRVAAWGVAALMAAGIAFATAGIARGANLAPIAVILLLPWLTLLLALLLGGFHLRRR